MTMPRRCAKRLCAVIAVSMLAAACAGESFIPDHDGTVEAPDAFRYQTDIAAAEAAALGPDPAALARWWDAFDDQTLSALIDRALAQNLSIDAAIARIREAEARAGEARAGRFPVIGAAATAEGEGQAPRGASADVGGRAELGLRASWEPDLFGRRGLEIAAAETEVDRRDAVRRDLVSILTADVATALIDLRSAAGNVRLLNEQRDNLSRVRGLIGRQTELGAGTRLDIDRAEIELSLLEARIPQAEAAVETARDRLRVLLGGEYGDLPGPGLPDLDEGDVPTASALPNPGIPADLLTRRPDLREAERAFRIALIEAGQARAVRMPQLSIPGLIGIAVSGFGTGAIVEAAVSSLEAGLNVTLFDAGAAQARGEAADARVEEAFLNTRTALIEAVSEVETAMIEIAEARARLDGLDRGMASRQRALGASQRLFGAGMIGILDVLDAQRAVNQANQERLNAKTDLALSQVRLFRGLGGGWSPDDEESASTSDEAGPGRSLPIQTSSAN